MTVVYGDSHQLFNEVLDGCQIAVHQVFAIMVGISNHAGTQT